MEYEVAKEKVMTVFYGMEGRQQVKYVAKSLSFVYDVEIFPMSEFDTFCKKHFTDAEVNEILQDSYDFGLQWDKRDKWGMWNKKDNTFCSAFMPTEFALDEDELFMSVALPRDLAWLGFTADEIAEIRDAVKRESYWDGQAYKIILGDESGKNRELYDPSAVTVDGKFHLDGANLMENAFLDKYLSWGISLKLLDTYRRVMWIGQYANGMDYLYDESLVASKEESPYYLMVKKNAPDSVEIPDYEEAWAKRKKPSPYKLPWEELHPERMKWDALFLVNKDKKEYVDVKKYMERSLSQSEDKVVINPMVLLTVVGNTDVTGDYYGTGMEMVGAWSWNLIGFAKEVPKGYREITPIFVAKRKIR